MQVYCFLVFFCIMIYRYEEAWQLPGCLSSFQSPRIQLDKILSKPVLCLSASYPHSWKDLQVHWMESIISAFSSTPENSYRLTNSFITVGQFPHFCKNVLFGNINWHVYWVSGQHCHSSMHQLGVDFLLKITLSMTCTDYVISIAFFIYTYFGLRNSLNVSQYQVDVDIS